MGKKTTFQVRTIQPEILFPSTGTPILVLQEHQQARNLLELLPGPQYRFLFRSKQRRATSTEDPQPKKKQKSASGPQSTARPVSLPIISELPRDGFNSDDSDDDAASRAASPHDHTANDLSRDTTIPPTIPTTTPPGTSTPLVLTPNPTIRILQPTESSRPPSDPPSRPWSNTDDQELINLKK